MADQYILKQCTKLTEEDTSLFTVIGVISANTELIIKDSNKRNSGLSKELQLQTIVRQYSEEGDEPFSTEHEEQEHTLLDYRKNSHTNAVSISYISHNQLHKTIQSLPTKDVLLFSDTSKYAELFLPLIATLCLKNSKEPAIAVPSNGYSSHTIKTLTEMQCRIIFSDTISPPWLKQCSSEEKQSVFNYFTAMEYNHTLTTCAINGAFGGGWSPPAEYETLVSIVSSEAYRQNVLWIDIDHRKVRHAWTPWIPKAGKTPEYKPLTLDLDLD